MQTENSLTLLSRIGSLLPTQSWTQQRMLQTWKDVTKQNAQNYLREQGLNYGFHL